jgi:cyclic pyranopterin phosphate synthase
MHVVAPARRLQVLSEGAAAPALPPRPAWFDAIPAELRDGSERLISYARLSVTDRCDLACVYCMPPEGERDHVRRAELLDIHEVARLVGVLARSGVGRVRLTGGEPLVRRDVVALVARAHARAPGVELAMTTNGTRLAELARPLAAAGLRSVNVSIDSLDPERFRRITRGGALGPVLTGVRAALDAGLAVKLNTVVLGEESLAEVPRVVDWAWALGLVPRFIELMPIGEAAALPSSAFVSAARVRSVLAARGLVDEGRAGPGHGPARYLRSPGSALAVGVIGAASEPFCDACNRMRISARGELRGCLGHPGGVALRPLLRQTDDDREIAWALRVGLGDKAAGHGFGAREATGCQGALVPPAHARVGMSLIGG